MRYFSVQEAEALIPRLEEIFKSVFELAAKARAKADNLHRLQADDRRAAEFAIEKGQLDFLTRSMNDRLKNVVDLGALPKGLDPALVDFPARLAGREVYLCWKLGEKTITHYHGLEDGFSGRKALPRPAR